MRRVLAGSILGCWFLAAAVGCGGSNASGPPSTWKALPVKGEHRKTNASRNQGSLDLPDLPALKK